MRSQTVLEPATLFGDPSQTRTWQRSAIQFAGLDSRFRLLIEIYDSLSLSGVPQAKNRDRLIQSRGRGIKSAETATRAFNLSEELLARSKTSQINLSRFAFHSDQFKVSLASAEPRECLRSHKSYHRLDDRQLRA